MHHIRLATLTLVVITALCPAVAYGQVSTSARSDTQTPTAALREKAFDVIDSVASQIGTLQSAENRARFGANIADALWTRDEKRARTLFIAVEEDINAGLRNAEGDDRSKAVTRAVFLQLRINTVERIAKHDSEFALSFLKATEFSEELPRTTGFINNERNLTLSIARKLAADNPELALKLGRESLAAGFSNELLALLRKLNPKHKEQSVSLYTDIIEKLKNLDLKRNSDAFYFAQNLAYSFRPPLADEASFRELNKVFTASAMAHGCAGKMSDEDQNRYFCMQLGAIISRMEVDPTRVARLKQSTSEQSDAEWSPDAYEEMNDVNTSGTIDELLALATRYPYLKGYIYRMAVRKATASGDSERAEKIAADYDGDFDTKQLMLKQLERDREWASITDEKMTQLQKTLNALPGPSERISLLMSVAGQIGSSDRKTSLKLLDQANQMVETIRPGRGQIETQMMLATMYCSEKSDRGLAIMESLIPKLNELVAATAKLDGYDYRNLRDGEWNMSSQGSAGALLTGLAQSARYFAWCDFERAVSLTMQFERTEIRLMAQLKLAQGILAGEPPRIRRDSAVVY
jgi:hypothetical protein